MPMNPERQPWELLEMNRPEGDALTARIAFPEISDFLLAAIDSSGKRHFLLPLSAGEQCLRDERSRGVTVDCRDLVVKAGKAETGVSRYIDIRCEEVEGQDGFDVIGRQIASLLKLGGISKAESVRRILMRWRLFWGRPPASVLSKDAIVGLFAELRYLSKWVIPYMPLNTALSGWKGPRGGRHDFEWQNLSVEVKGTTIVHGRKHWIHGLDQLMPPEQGKLLFYSLKLREEGGAENTLPEIIRYCYELISGNIEALDTFEGNLALAGYSPAHDGEYEEVRFRIVDEALYTVTGRFPRIVPGSFDRGPVNGVDAVEYEINLDGFEDLIVSKTPVGSPTSYL
ncbi:MAG: PD-(D/E)XK motif protein [Thermofilum sp.]